MTRTAQQLFEEAHAASVKSRGEMSYAHMTGYLAAKLADALNELDAYQVPACEPGHIQTAFVHQGLHLVAEWSGSGEDEEVHFLWLGSDDILDLVATEAADVPDWVYDAIDRDNAEQRLDMQLHIAGV